MFWGFKTFTIIWVLQGVLIFSETKKARFTLLGTLYTQISFAVSTNCQEIQEQACQVLIVKQRCTPLPTCHVLYNYYTSLLWWVQETNIRMSLLSSKKWCYLATFKDFMLIRNPLLLNYYLYQAKDLKALNLCG